MILHAPHVLRALRWVPPSAVIIGSTASYLTALAALWIACLPLSRHLYDRGERVVYGSYIALLGFFFETWSGVEFVYYGDKLPLVSENVLYMSNHQCTVDWLVAELLCLKQGPSGRNCYILKDAIKNIPLYGWQLGARGGIYIKRGKGQDKHWLKSEVDKFAEADTPLWLVIFPEGTRFDPRDGRKLERSRSFSSDLGLPELHHVLAPKTTGFEITLQALRSHISAVYDVTIMYEGREGARMKATHPNLFGFFSGQCDRVHIYFRRMPIEDIPSVHEDCQQWLYNCFLAKDQLLESFVTTGSFHKPLQHLPLPISLTLPSTILHSSILLLAATTRCGRWWWTSSILFFTVLGLVLVRVRR